MAVPPADALRALCPPEPGHPNGSAACCSRASVLRVSPTPDELPCIAPRLRALLEAMREQGYEGTEQDLGYLIKRAFRAHPAVKKAKCGKKGVRWEGLAAA